MANLLFVCHSPSPNTLSLRDALLAGAADPAVTDVAVRCAAPLEAAADDVFWCDALIIGTTENFGAMAGLTKDFLERIYYPCLDKTQGLPVALYIRAGEDGRGTRQGIEKIFTGLRWQLVQKTLILRGAYSDEFTEQTRLLGMTMAAGLEAGIF